MSGAAFTKSYKDRSTDSGFQFEFFCDRSHGMRMPNWLTYYLPEPCSYSFRSTLQPYPVAIANNVKKATSWLTARSPELSKAGNAIDSIHKEIRDSALSAAIAEAKLRFRQCSGCNRWVCEQHCFDETALCCKDCCRPRPSIDPNFVACIHCGELGDKDGLFCATCGKRMFLKLFCGNCGHTLESGKHFTFCPDCGDQLDYFDDL